MQEIANDIFIETHYPGVTLGAIGRKHGLVLIDAPFRQDDARSWRSALLNLGGGITNVMIQLDAHIDRTMGAKAMECTILSHSEAASAFQNRPASIKAQKTDEGAEWENFNGLGSIRWGTPHITFSDQMFIHWDDRPIKISHRPGISEGTTWVDLQVEKILFLGDTVVVNQTPFLMNSNLSLWLSHLNELLSPQYQDYFFVGGRNGLINYDDIYFQISFLNEINNQLLDLLSRKATVDSVKKLVPDLMKKIPVVLPENNNFYIKRLTHGIQNYYSSLLKEKNKEE